MLGYYDEVYLGVNNVINKKGEKYLINFSLPQNFEYISFPDDVIKVSVYEVEQKRYNQRYNDFSVLVGDVSTIENLTEDDQCIKLSFLIDDDNYLNSDDPVCYFKDEDDNCVVFAKIKDEDVVVGSIEELEETIMDISNDFDKIKKNIGKIKKYVYKQ